MKKNRWIAALAVMVMALVVGECSNPSSGNESTSGSSGGSGNSSGAGNSGVDYNKYQVGDFILKDGTILSKDETSESGTVAAVIVRAAADGSQFGTSLYWSCCQSPSSNSDARGLYFGNGNMGNYDKNNDNFYVCSVRAFN